MILKRLTFLILLFVAVTSYSQVPETMSFQGILNDSNGDVVSDDSYTLEFELYDALTAGTKVWGPESHSAATVNGLYSVLLGGNGVPLDITNSFDSQYFLQVKVNGELLTPRIQLTTSPYAFTSRAVKGSDNVFPATGNVGIGTSSPTSELDVAGTVTAIGFSGAATNLTGLNATNITTGTLADSHLETVVDIGTLNTTGGINVGGTTDPGAGNLAVTGTVTATSYTGVGSGLTGLDATNITSGTLADSHLEAILDIGSLNTTGGINVGGTTDPGAGNLLVTGSATAISFVGDGSALTNLPPTSPIWTGSGDISYSGGSVGIGTATPASALDVVGTVTATSFTGDGGGLTNLASSPWTLAAPDVYYNVGGGNVGIGTSTPATELDVVGNVTATTFTGSGASLTALNAANITTGTIDNLRLDTDLQDLADGSLSGSIIGAGIDGANITDGTVTSAKISGTIAIAEGGTNATTATAARTNLGLVIGTNVQAYDAGLNSIAGLTTTADRMIYATASDTYAVTTLSGFGRSIIDDADEAAFKSTVNLEIGTDVQAYDTDLANLAVGNGTGLTSLPSIYGSALELQGAGPILRLDGTTGNPKLLFQENGVDKYQMEYLPASNYFSISETGVGEWIVIRDGGLVALGHNNPANKLHVKTGMPGAVAQLEQTDDANTASLLFNISGTEQWSIGSMGDNSFRMSNSTEPGTNDFLTVTNAGAGPQDMTFNTPFGYVFNTNGGQTIIDEFGRLSVNGSNSATVSTFNVETTSPAGFVMTVNADYALGTAGLVAFQQQGINQGLITVSGATVNYGAFTGSHFAQSDYDFERGQVVVMTGNYTFQNGMDYGEPVYEVTISKDANDSKVLGTYFSKTPHDGDIDMVSAVGNGDVWVVDKGENLVAGDYLISSNIPGQAMKDTGEFEVAYVFARVAEDVDWSQVIKKIDGVKHKKISIFYESFARNHKVEMLEKKLEDLREEVEQLKKFLYQTNY